MEWLRRPLVAAGETVAGPLDPTRLTDADLRDICQRMHAILDTIEMPRCEGRLIPLGLFDAIDTLGSLVVHGHAGPDGHRRPPSLADWTEVIREFGQYYCLDGTGPIAVDLVYFRDVAVQYGWAANPESGKS